MKGGHENLFKNLPPPFPPRAVPLPLFGCAGRSTREVKWLLLLLLPPLGASSKERSRKYDLFPAHLGKLHLVLYVLSQLRVLFSQSSLMSSFNADFFLKKSGVHSVATLFFFSLIEEPPFASRDFRTDKYRQTDTRWKRHKKKNSQRLVVACKVRGGAPDGWHR